MRVNIWSRGKNNNSLTPNSWTIKNLPYRRYCHQNKIATLWKIWRLRKKVWIHKSQSKNTIVKFRKHFLSSNLLKAISISEDYPLIILTLIMKANLRPMNIPYPSQVQTQWILHPTLFLTPQFFPLQGLIWIKKKWLLMAGDSTILLGTEVGSCSTLNILMKMNSNILSHMITYNHKPPQIDHPIELILIDYKISSNNEWDL